jgi:anti-sigma factor (TIGR02949 family)
MTMTCPEVRERLSPFMDDELDPVTSRDIEQHLRSCPECAEALTAIEAMRDRLREDLEYHRAPDLLRARIQRQTQATVRRPTPVPRAVWGWAATAAAVIVVAGVTWLTTLRSSDDAIAHDVVSSHIRSLMASHLTDVASTDQHTVKPWFNGRIDYAPPVTDFATEGFPLIGGRLDYLENHPVTALVYQRRKHVINVFVWPNPNEREAFSSVRSERGFHVIRATHSGMEFWVVSDLNADELTAFARLLTGHGSSGA